MWGNKTEIIRERHPNTIRFDSDPSDGAIVEPVLSGDGPFILVPVEMERRCVFNSWSTEEVRNVVRYEWALGGIGKRNP